MGTNRIEVSQQHDTPIRIRYTYIFQDVFIHQLGCAIWVGCSTDFGIFCNRTLFRIAIYGCRRREYKCLTSGFRHCLIQIDGTGNIVFIVYKRFFHRFTDCLVSGKMDDRINAVFRKYTIQTIPIQNIHFIELRHDSCDCFNPVQDCFAGIVQIVHNHNFITILD